MNSTTFTPCWASAWVIWLYSATRWSSHAAWPTWTVWPPTIRSVIDHRPVNRPTTSAWVRTMSAAYRERHCRQSLSGMVCCPAETAVEVS